MILERRAVEPFFKNGFVIGCEDTREGIVIDPGDEVDQLLAAAAQHQLKIVNILLTHAHLDHVTGVGRAKQALGVPIWLHRADNNLYGVVEQGQMFGIRVEQQRPGRSFHGRRKGAKETKEARRRRSAAVRTLQRARAAHAGALSGGVCLAVNRENETAATLFVGGTLFAGSIRRAGSAWRQHGHAAAIDQDRAVRIS